MMTPSLQNVITDFAFCNNIPIFVIKKDKEMETTIIRIGNSRGIIIPSALLKKYRIGDGDRVLLEENAEGGFTLSFLQVGETYSGPFTGPFKALAELVDEDAWGGKDVDPCTYVRQLRDDRGREKKTLPEW